jgi:YfiH family protein
MAALRFSDDGVWPLGRFAALDALPSVVHGVTTRSGPDLGTDAHSARCAQGARAVAQRLGLTGVAWVQQMHGGVVLRATGAGLAGQADALVSDAPGLGVLGRSADCPLILATGQRRDGTWAVGFAHASWRSTVARITATMLGRLTEELDVQPATVRAAIAPFAGPCCYEVGDEVLEQALAALGSQAAAYFTRPAASPRWHFDLGAANLAQLATGGVDPARVTASGVCTICQGDRFWSWRRQGPEAGRFAAVIGLGQPGL